MAVISVTLTESEEQIVSGIPKTIAISTNIASSIFYTLDGTIPTLFSTVYTGPIFLPFDKLSVILNILATNGVDTSPIITETFITNMVDGTNARFPHSGTSAQSSDDVDNLYPFGTNQIQPNAGFVNPADAGITVNNPALPSISTGFDGNNNPTGFTNQSYDLTNYSIKYSITNKSGETGYGIGNLPANIKTKLESSPPEETNKNSNTFDPRAFVIFQDASTEDLESPPHINKMNFSMENPEKVRDGNNFFTSGLDSPPISGTFLRSHFNPRTNSITYYYLDTWTNRWIISTMPYNPNSSGVTNLAGTTFVGGGAGKVYEWSPFRGRVLF